MCALEKIISICFFFQHPDQVGFSLSRFTQTTWARHASGFFEQGLSYTLLSRLLIGASRSVLVFFLQSHNFSFLYLSFYTTFESETWQFTETFEIECGENSLGFLLYYIDFKIIFVEF
jgi:hypothetical protein